MHQGAGAGSLEFLAVVVALHVVLHHRRSVLRALGRPPGGRPAHVVPAGRPIEAIAADARRLRQRFRHLPDGIRFAKYEALRGAYDGVLAEACAALGHPHLLGVLRPGSERDAERDRVEDLLDRYGFHLQDAR